jgi:hypothetical protein
MTEGVTLLVLFEENGDKTILHLVSYTQVKPLVTTSLLLAISINAPDDRFD